MDRMPVVMLLLFLKLSLKRVTKWRPQEVRPTSRFRHMSQSAELLVKLSPRTVADITFVAMTFLATVLGLQ